MAVGVDAARPDRVCTDVAIIGAGILGLAAAVELARAGLRVTVLDRAHPGAGTSSRGEGNILVSDKVLPAELAMAMRSVELWAAFADSSREPFEYQPKGGIVTAATHSQLTLLQAQARQQSALGVTWHTLDADALHDEEPGISPHLAGGLLYPQDAQVMPIQAVRALTAAAVDLGVEVLVDHDVMGMTRSGTALRLQTTRGACDAGIVVNAAGPWAGALADRLGGHAPVFPRRGMILVTEALPPGTVRHKVYDGRYIEAVGSDDAAAQVAPVVESTDSGTVLIGSTREAVGWDDRMRWDLAGSLAGSAIGLFPCLASVSLIRTYQGFRPATPDHLPLIGPDATVEGLFHLSGHEGAGIGLALASAEVLRSAVVDGVTDADFDPRRFGTGDNPAVMHPSATRSFALGGTTGRAPAFHTAEHTLPRDITAAAERLADGEVAWRTTRVADRPRGLFCGIGHCHDCLLSTDSGRTVRACVSGPEGLGDHRPQPGTAEPVGQGPVAAVGPAVDVIVLGAGPAGLAAARAAGSAGASVLLIDRYDIPGGQIGRQPRSAEAPVGPYADDIRRGTRHARVMTATEVVTVQRVVDGWDLLLQCEGELHSAAAAVLVIATGARESVAPFPGWDLPGVMTAGALQALVKREGGLPFRRPALAGSGPLLLAVGQAMADAGQRAVFTAEARPLTALVAGGAATAVRVPAKAVQFARLSTGRLPWFGWRVVEAIGRDRVAQVRLEHVGRRPQWLTKRERIIDVDALGVSAGLVPDVGIALQLGCLTSSTQDGVATLVTVDGRQQTSVPRVFAAGEVTGVGGAEKSRVEGVIAGLQAAAEAGHVLGDRARQRLGTLAGEARRWRRFADDLQRVYPFDHAWADTAGDDLLVCRCEEVPMGAVRRAIAEGATSARAVKGVTRCGMGYCQGNVCSPIIRSALVSAGHPDTGHLESRPLATPVTLGQMTRLGPPDRI